MERTHLDKRQQAEYDLETIMGEAGYNLTMKSKSRIFFKEYNTKSMGLIKIVPSFNNDPDDKSFKSEEPTTLKSVALVRGKQTLIIAVNKQTTMSEIVGLPYECMFDLSTIIVCTRSHAQMTVEPRFIVNKECDFCHKISRSFIELDKIYCNTCIGL
jgi:hypothetical protein